MSKPDAKLALAQDLEQALQASHADDLALRFAALSAEFDPQDALSAAGLDLEQFDSVQRMAVVSRLSQACDTQLHAPQWVMRASSRERILTAVSAAGNLAEAVAWRGALFTDTDSASVPVIADIGDALLGRGDFAPAAVAALLGQADPLRAAVERLLQGITLAKPVAPACGHLDQLRAALARLNAEPNSELIQFGVFGRDQQLATLAAFLDHCWNNPDAQTGILQFVGGIGGVGKSTLLAEARSRARAQNSAICIVFDFDRPGIDGNDPLGLSLELARQVADSLGAKAASLYAERIGSVGQAGRERGSGFKEALDLIEQVGQVVRDANRPMLLVLDTLENLVLRGDSAAGSLLEWLQSLRRAQPRIAVLGAGRGELHPALALLAMPPIILDGLDPESAERLLAKLDIAGPIALQLLGLAKGNPLVLRLGARLLKDDPKALTKARIDKMLTGELMAGQLYRLILARIELPAVRAVAHPGLLLRQINAALVAEVIGPEITDGGQRLDLAEAEVLIGHLQKYGWLVTPGPDAWLYHRQDLRTVLLELQIASDPHRARRLFAAAAGWHEERGELLLALYYRLQGLRWRKRLVPIDSTLARQFDQQMLDELPEAGRDLVHLARDERSSQLRSSAEVPGGGATSKERAMPLAANIVLSESHAQEIRAMLKRRNFGEAALMVTRTNDYSQIDPASDTGAAVIEALWRAGSWRQSSSCLRARWKALARSDKPESPELIAVAADVAPLALRAWLRRRPQRALAEARQVNQTAQRDPLYDVAALLMASENLDCANPFVTAVFALWVDGISSLDGMEGMVERLVARRPTTGKESYGQVGDIPALVRLLMLDPGHRDLLVDQRKLAHWGKWNEASDTIALATARGLGAVMDETKLSRFRGAYGLAQIDALGGLAHYADAMHLAAPGLGLEPIAQAIRRRALVVQGVWPFGAPPHGWVEQPLPLLAGLAINELMHSSDTGSAAILEIDRWLASPEPGPEEPTLVRLRRRCRTIAARSRKPLLADLAAAMADVASQLVASGLPLGVVPGLAVREFASNDLNAAPRFTGMTMPTP